MHYIFNATTNLFLNADERTWTPSLFEAASFGDRRLANDIAEREQERMPAQARINASLSVFDDGIEA